MYVGWTQVASDSELAGEVVPVDIRGRRLVAVHGDSGWVVCDGTCPHRGAHLGYGGRVDGSVVVCPFHGHRVHVGDDRPALFSVTRYPTLHAAGGLFVLLDDACETGLSGRLLALSRTHYVKPAFQRTLSIPAEYVIENVVDADHFSAVHALTRRPRLSVFEDDAGVLRVEGCFDMVRPNRWQVGETADTTAQARFSAEVFSPTVVVSELGSADAPNVVITAATPTADGGCVARVTVALPRRRESGAPTVGELSSLVSGSRTAFDQDAVIWDHLDTSVTPKYTEGDELVRAYRAYCQRFVSVGR